MIEISKDKWKEILENLVITESHSTCASKAVGCVIYDSNGEFLSSGYNRSVTSCSCISKFKKISGQWFYKKNDEWKHDETGMKHKLWSVSHEVHAEIDGLTQLKNFYNAVFAIVTYSPCLDCCKSLINSGISNIIYFYDFDNIEEIQELCKEANVSLIKIDSDSEIKEMYDELRKGYNGK